MNSEDSEDFLYFGALLFIFGLAILFLVYISFLLWHWRRKRKIILKIMEAQLPILHSTPKAILSITKAADLYSTEVELRIENKKKVLL